MMEFEENYYEAIRLSHNLVEDVRFSRIINLEPLKTCSDQMCKYLDTNINILELLNSVQGKNPYMFSHPVHVAIVSFVIGKWMDLKKSELTKIFFTGMVHDIGKAKIGDHLLNKSEKLTEQEIEKVRTHTVWGYKILTKLEVQDKDILTGVLFHHERQDGTGYPNRLRGNQISLFGKIIAIADIYDAITSKKSYDIKRTPFKAVEEIQAGSFGSLDPEVCQIFLNNIVDFYSGSDVRLSNEQVGKIVYIHPEEKTKPLIRCENEYIDLTQERNIEIVEMIQAAEN